MARLWNDLRFEVRLLTKSPVVLIATVLTFGLGIGANTAIFSVVKAILLRPLPGTRDPDQLFVVAGRTKAGQALPLSYPIFQEVRDRNDVLSTVAASAMTPLTLGIDGAPSRVWGELVSGTYFEALGTKTVLGRPILPSDEAAAGASPVAVITHALWQSRFGGDPGVVGRAITLNGHPFTIVGVAQETFRGSLVGTSFDVFVPLTMQAQVYGFDNHGDILHQPDTYWLIVQGRLKPGVRAATAQAALDVVGDQIAKAYPSDQMKQRASLIPLWRSPFGAQTLLPVVAVLMVVGLLVLLIACANIANILLARSAARTGEVAMRLALGAGRLQLFGQLLTGSLFVTVLGAAAGLAGASLMSGLFSNRPGPGGVPVALNAGADGPVFVFALALAALCGIVVGIVPAARVRSVALMSTLNGEAGARVVRRSWLMSGLVVSQIAISLVLLISAVLLIRSFQRMRSIDPGFQPQHGLMLTLDLKGSGYNQSTGWVFSRRMLQTVKGLGGVDEASLAWQLPVSGAGPAAPSASVVVEGYAPAKDDDAMIFHYNVVGPGYLRSLGIALVEGREFTERDDAQGPKVVMVNETMARRFWPGQNPVGRRLLTGGEWRTVAGVARDAKYLSMSEAPQPYFYLPYFQIYQPQVTLHVRTAGPPLALQNAVQDSVRTLDPTLPMVNVRTLERQVTLSFARVEQIAILLAAAGMIGLLLAVIGVYGVMSQNVAQATPAFGIRMALGATARDIFVLALSSGFRLLLIGVMVGVLASLAGTRLLRGVLFGVSPTDSSTFLGVTLLLATVVLVACSIPARRAANAQPMQILRHQ